MFPLPPPPTVPKESRDLLELPNALSSSNFKIYWGDRGNIQPEEAQALADALEVAWAVEVEEDGWPQPLFSESYLLNVYIANSGDGSPPDRAAGYYTRDDEDYPMLVFSPYTVKDPDALQGVSAHEFLHALQDATGAFADAPWIWEASAVWMEHHVYPARPDYANWLPGLALLPDVPLDTFDFYDENTLIERHAYGAFIAIELLTAEIASPQALQRWWTEADDPDPLKVLAKQLPDYNSDLAEFLGLLAAHNAVWDYQDGELYAQIVAEGLGMWDLKPEADYIPLGGMTDWATLPADQAPQGQGYALVRYSNPPAGPLLIEQTADPVGDQGSPADWRIYWVSTGPEGVDRVLLTDPSTALTLSGHETEGWLVFAETAPGLTNERFSAHYRLSHPLPDPPPSQAPADCGCNSAAWEPWALSLCLVPFLRRRHS